MRRSGYNLGMARRAGVRTARDQPRNMGNIRHHHGTHFICNLPEARIIDRPRICARPHDDDFGTVLLGLAFHFVEIDDVVFGIHSIRHHLEPPPRESDRMPMGQVATMREVHSQKRIARFEQAVIHSGVRLGAAVRLHGGVIHTEKRLCPLDGEGFGHVYELTPAIISSSRKSFRVFVRHHAAYRFHHRLAHVVLRSDEFEFIRLAFSFIFHGGENIGISQRKCR